MKNYSLSILVLIAIIVFAIVRLNCNKSDIKAVVINNQKFNVEIAQTAPERETGLMNRKSLDLNAGMFFIFSKSDIQNFWMKNTLIPLDIIWLAPSEVEGTLKIVDIQTLQPATKNNIPQYTPKVKASYVLEINAGLSNQYGFKIGDVIKISTN